MLAAVLALVAWGKMPDLWVAGPAAVLVVVTGLVGIDEVGDTIDRLAPTLAFLAAVFVLAEVARDAGLFSAAGAWMGARASSSRRLVLVVSAVAIVVTVLMSLDATAVLFTPVVVELVPGAERSDRRCCATAQLAGASSSLLPVSNLTNSARFSATDLTFSGFAVPRMALPRWRRGSGSRGTAVRATATTDRLPPPASASGGPARRVRRVRRRRPRGTAGRVLRRVRSALGTGPLDRARRARRRQWRVGGKAGTPPGAS